MSRTEAQYTPCILSYDVPWLATNELVIRWRRRAGRENDRRQEASGEGHQGKAAC
jgi:hypothetical protein